VSRIDRRAGTGIPWFTSRRVIGDDAGNTPR
jgi:hypothetical protein